MVTRRGFALAGVAALTACRREKAIGFPGYAFVANHEGNAIAAVDLEVFAVARHIPLDGQPTAVAASSRHGRVYALTPENGCVHEIRTDQLTFSRKLRVAAQATEMRLSPAGDALYVLCQKPKQFVRLTLTRCKSRGQFHYRMIRRTSICHPMATLRQSAPFPDARLHSSMLRIGGASRRCARRAKSGWCAFNRYTMRRGRNRIRGN